MQHSKVVGGSTAKRVINCPGSVALVAKMPPQPASKYAEEGTMLHEVMDKILGTEENIGSMRAQYDLTDEQVEKVTFCVNTIYQIDAKAELEFAQEVTVGFDGVPALDGVFGNADLVGRLGNRTIVLDWKFGNGVLVEAEENPQGLFYAAAAARTAKLDWATKGTDEVEIIIVQPPKVSRWVTTWKRVHEFERELIEAVRAASRPDAPTAVGDWCRFCTAKPICPSMTGAVDRVVHTALANIDDEALARALELAEMLDSFIAEAKTLAQARLERGMKVPGWKLVAKRATRQWVDESKAEQALMIAGLTASDIHKTELLSPAQAEKVCKKSGVAFPTDQVVAVSSGNTIAPANDPRSEVMVLGAQLRVALSKVQ